MAMWPKPLFQWTSKKELRMQSLYPELMKLMTPEVFTVVGGLVMIGVGWKVAWKTISMAKGFTSKFSLLSLCAATLLMIGLSGSTYSGGQVISRINEYRKSNKVDQSPAVQVAQTLSAEDLAKIGESAKDAESTKALLAYAALHQAKNGDFNMQQVAELVAKSSKDNQEAVVEFIRLLQSKEGKAKKRSPVSLASLNAADVVSVYERQGNADDGTPLPPTDIYAPQVAEVADKNSLPTAAYCGMFGLSIAAVILSINTYNNRHLVR